MILGIRQTMDQEDNSGSPEDLSRIIAATEYMDGLDHAGASAVQLETAIKQITRRGTRRNEAIITPPSIPAIDGYENGSAFAIDVTQDMINENAEGRGGFTFGFYGITLKKGHASYSVHWGDGTQNTGLTVSVGVNQNGTTCFGNTNSSAAQTGTNGTVTDGTAEVCHTYSTPGTYVIQISDDIAWFGFGGSWYYDTWSLLISAGKVNLAKRMRNARYAVSHALRWGEEVTDAGGTYAECFKMLSLCAWNSRISYARGTYNLCTGLTGSVPAWGSAITNACGTYNLCTGLTGSVPAWGSAITNAENTYGFCNGLTGSVPAWGSKITDASHTYNGCAGLTGSVPAWGSAIINANSTYNGCSGLTGDIPAWGAEITTANATYYKCKGLTGVWDSTASDAELMPSKITNKGNCVANCLPDLRQYFLTTWGGTRAN